MAPSGTSWRCGLVPFDHVQWNVNRWAEIMETEGESAYHSSGAVGNEYFGWADTKSDTARTLAEKIRSRFPRLMAKSKRLNLEYAGWFTYMLGLAEQGHLPIMAAEYQEAHRNRLATVSEDVWIKGPPLFSMWQFRDKSFYYARPPHLRPDDDWHDAYQRMIRGWQGADLRCSLPQYPIETEDKFELGAYWEGAIYFIQTILGFTDIRCFLSALETSSQDSEHWHIFFRVWNSHDQLIYLTAFLNRRLLAEHGKYQLEDTERNSLEQRLNSFECQTRHKWVESGKPPNPYYGGCNPLHLGLTLTGIRGDRLVNT